MIVYAGFSSLETIYFENFHGLSIYEYWSRVSFEVTRGRVVVITQLAGAGWQEHGILYSIPISSAGNRAGFEYFNYADIAVLLMNFFEANYLAFAFASARPQRDNKQH